MVYTFNLEQKNIIITGGYGYLGRAIVNSLLYHNARVFVLGRNKEKFKEAFSGQENTLKNLSFEYCNIAESESIVSAFQRVFEKTGKIDILINNAFYSKGQSPEHMTDEDWEEGIEGTLNGVFRGIRAIIPYFKRAGGGKIINLSSMYGIVAPEFKVYEESPEFLNPPHYGAAKAGVIQLTKYYASYLGKWNIKVNTVSPGPFPSKIVQETKGFINALKDKTLLGQIGKPEDLAGVFVYLASDASNYMTGQNLIIDGGWTAK